MLGKCVIFRYLDAWGFMSDTGAYLVTESIRQGIFEGVCIIHSQYAGVPGNIDNPIRLYINYLLLSLDFIGLGLLCDLGVCMF